MLAKGSNNAPCNCVLPLRLKAELAKETSERQHWQDQCFHLLDAVGMASETEASMKMLLEDQDVRRTAELAEAEKRAAVREEVRHRQPSWTAAGFKRAELSAHVTSWCCAEVGQNDKQCNCHSVPDGYNHVMKSQSKTRHDCESHADSIRR